MRSAMGGQKGGSMRVVLMAGVALTLVAPAAASAQNDGAPAEEAEADIVVTGSRIQRADIEAPVPTKVLGAEAIEARGSTSIGDFLRA